MISPSPPKSLRRLPNHRYPAKVLAHGLDGVDRALEELLVLHAREDFLDHDVLWYAEVRRVVYNVVDPAQQPHHERLDEVLVLPRKPGEVPALESG